MGKTISQLNGGTVVTSLDGTELLEAEKDGVSVPITAQGIADLAGGGGAAAYLVYTALLTQSGTDAPVATVLQNTLGGTVVWSRNTTGDFSATLVGAFTTNKTTVLSSINGDQSAGYVILYETPSEDEVKLYQKNNSSVSADQLGCTVEIRVYP